MHGRFHITCPHKEFACFLTILHQSSQICVFDSLAFGCLGNFTIFLSKISIWLHFKRNLVKIQLFPNKICLFLVKYIFCFVLCLTFVILLHKIKFYAPLCFCLANHIFCGIFISKCQNICYMQCLAFLFNNNCVLLQRTLISFEWCFFESNVFLFCSQPHIFACIMDFVGVQILCQHANKLTNVNFSWH